MAGANRAAVPVLAALLTIATSCVDVDNTVGSSYVPLDQNIYILTQEFDLPVGHRYPDSLNTELFDYLPVGSISTPEYGNVTVGAAVSIVPSLQFKEWGENPVFKSMVLSLATSSVQTLDDNQKYIPQNIYVHRLTKDLDSTMVYGNSLNESDYTAQQCCKGANITTGLDTVYIEFPEEFAKPIFSMDSTTMDSVELFVKKFKGLYIRTDKRRANDIGGRLSEFNISKPCLTLNYTSTRKSDGQRRDTSEQFYLSGSMAHGIMTLDHDRNIPEKKLAETEIRTEGLGGITPFVSGKELRDIFDKWMEGMGVNRNNLMVSKAVIELPVHFSGSYENYVTYPINLFPARRMKDSIGNVVYMPINEIYTQDYNNGSLVTNLDDGKDAYYYRPDAALFIQSLIKEDYDKVDSSYDIWLMPTSSYSVTTKKNNSAISDYYSYYYYSYYGVDINSSTQTFYCVDNLTYYQGTLSGTAADLRPKLKLTYTVIAE